MRQFILFFCILSMSSCQSEKKPATDALLARAREVHEQVICLDTHVDINVKNFTDSLNYKADLPTQVTLPKMKAGGLDVAWFIVYTGQDSLSPNGYARASKNALDKFNAIHWLCDTLAPDQIGLALNSDDVRRLYASGKKVAMIGVENAYPLGEDLSMIAEYHARGARYMSLAHNGHNQFADSHTGESDGSYLHNGLSELGKKAVYEMNRLGIIVDVSHPSKEAIRQLITLSRAPVIASHSSARALCDTSRNLDDELLLMIKERGGVVQAVALDEYLDKEKSEAREAFMKKVYRGVADSLGIEWHDMSAYNRLDPAQQEALLENYPVVRALAAEKVTRMDQVPPAVSVSDLADHIDYMVELMGIDHVGISSDFDGGGGIEGWSDASETFNVTYELVKRGYSGEAIAKLWGGNLLRVLDEVQEVAGNMAAN